MKDETYVFVSDVREKKRTARGSFNRRTHAGKGGTVKLPSDYLTRRELKAMSGEVKSYRLNEPMSWAEFKAMPSDLQVTYINAIRNKFSVPDGKIAEMFGTNKDAVSRYFQRLALNMGRPGKRVNWDQEGWRLWCSGESAADVRADAEDQESGADCPADTELDAGQECAFRALPVSGTLDFECSAEAALDALEQFLGGCKVQMSVSWKIISKGDSDG